MFSQRESAMLATDVNENHRESVAEFVSCCSKVFSDDA